MILFWLFLGIIINSALSASTGYNYQQSGSANRLGLASTNSASIASLSQQSNAQLLAQQQLDQSGSALLSQPLSSQSQPSLQQASQFAEQTYEEPTINKHFYIHSAPEDADSNPVPKNLILGKPQKNYRVLFIKAPASSVANKQIVAQYAPQEEKTHIYVLTQKEHEINVNDIATPAPTQPSKPEVFFIKYQTPQEAEHAQRQIQAQYDALGGASQTSDEGVAPHSSFIGALGSSASSQRLNPPPPPKKPNNNYLPSKLV